MNNIFGGDSSNNTETAKSNSNQYDLLSGFLNNTNTNQNSEAFNNPSNNNAKNQNNNDLFSNLGLVKIFFKIRFIMLLITIIKAKLILL